MPVTEDQMRLIAQRLADQVCSPAPSDQTYSADDSIQTSSSASTDQTTSTGIDQDPTATASDQVCSADDTGQSSSPAATDQVCSDGDADQESSSATSSQGTSDGSTGQQASNGQSGSPSSSGVTAITPEWRRGFGDGLTGATASPLTPSPGMYADYEEGYQAGQWFASHPASREASHAGVGTVSAPGSSAEAAASFNPLGLVGYKFKLPEGEPIIHREIPPEAPRFDCEVYLEGDFVLLSSSPVTMANDGTLSVAFKQKVGDWVNSVGLGDVSKKGATLRDSFGNKFSSVSFETDGTKIILKGTIKFEQEIETPVGSASFEASGGYKIELTPLPGESDDEDEDSEGESEGESDSTAGEAESTAEGGTEEAATAAGEGEEIMTASEAVVETTEGIEVGDVLVDALLVLCVL